MTPWRRPDGAIGGALLCSELVARKHLREAKLELEAGAIVGDWFYDAGALSRIDAELDPVKAERLRLEYIDMQDQVGTHAERLERIKLAIGAYKARIKFMDLMLKEFGHARLDRIIERERFDNLNDTLRALREFEQILEAKLNIGFT
jgi:hypothetical protein